MFTHNYSKTVSVQSAKFQYHDRSPGISLPHCSCSCLTLCLTGPTGFWPHQRRKNVHGTGMSMQWLELATLRANTCTIYRYLFAIKQFTLVVWHHSQQFFLKSSSMGVGVGGGEGGACVRECARARVCEITPQKNPAQNKAHIFTYLTRDASKRQHCFFFFSRYLFSYRLCFSRYLLYK